MRMQETSDALRFDRITFFCPRCKRAGIIMAAWLALTQVKLEGRCIHCRESSVRTFDLLTIDRWLNDETSVKL